MAIVTEEEVTEAFIRAAEIERRMPNTGEKPRSYGGWTLPIVHTFEDKLGWRKEIGDHLHRGDDPLSEERQAFTDGRSSRISAEEVSLWERCIQWTVDLVDDERERRALWHWAAAQAGGRPFTKWCFRIERIHVETGRRRKNRAIAKISEQLARSGLQNSETSVSGVLRVGPVSEDSHAILGDDVRQQNHVWHDDSYKPIFDPNVEHDFSWAEARNRKRRQRRERRQKAEEQV